MIKHKKIVISVLTGVGIIATISTVAFVQSRDIKLEKIYKKNSKLNYICVNISGAIAFPGTYYLKPNTTLKQLLMIVHPSNNANLKVHDLNKVLVNNSKIKIVAFNSDNKENVSSRNFQIKINLNTIKEFSELKIDGVNKTILQKI
ncbi:UNVERIFIED_CONTAM: hypothetical protein O8I53_05965 [Campylobacter lari]